MTVRLLESYNGSTSPGDGITYWRTGATLEGCCASGHVRKVKGGSNPPACVRHSLTFYSLLLESRPTSCTQLLFDPGLNLF